MFDGGKSNLKKRLMEEKINLYNYMKNSEVELANELQSFTSWHILGGRRVLWDLHCNI